MNHSHYIFRVDDVHPAMNRQNFERFKEIFERNGIRALLAVIPENQDSDLMHAVPDDAFWKKIELMCEDGWTIGMHGWQHSFVTTKSGILGINAYSEFAGLPYNEQYSKLCAGKDLLCSYGIDTDIFVAPAHSFDTVTCSALRDSGFKIISDGVALWPFFKFGLVWMPQISWRLRVFPFGVITFCLHLDEFSEEDFASLEKFVVAHKKHITTFSRAVSLFRRKRVSLVRTIGNGMIKIIFYARMALKKHI